jgi:hypothetical protein
VPVTSSRPSSALQDDLQLLRLAVAAYRGGMLGEEDYPHIALLLTDCFGDELERVVEGTRSKIEAASSRVGSDLENDDALLAAMFDVAYQAFWLALTEAPGLSRYHFWATG